jgi:NAD(P)-dependent dehydrogenase (short-subunit alcohol dehydrogenase family)
MGARTFKFLLGWSGQKMASQLDFSLQNKVAVVTGASKGIGRGLAKMLAQAGAKVAVTARTISQLEELVQEIKSEGGIAQAFQLDVCNVPQIDTVFNQIYNHFGSLDIAVNNAGLGQPILAVDVTEENWDSMMSVNLKGLFFCCQAEGRIMLKQGHGKIINMSSQASVVGIPGEVVYCTSKGGVNQLTKVLALEWSDKGVNVNAVGPTFIYTPGTAERLDTPAYRDNVLSHLPIGRVGTIADVAGAVIYLASAASDLVSGTLLLVDGGWTAQ